MARIILITRKFPPVNETGSRRAAAFAKYLRRLGWDITVMTSDCLPGTGRRMTAEEAQANAGMDGIEFIRVKPYTEPVSWCRWLDRRRRQGVAWNLAGLPFSESQLWSASLQQELDGKAVTGDIIWATYPHIGTLLVASWLSRRLHVPWIADFRDLPCEFEDRKWVLWTTMHRLRQITRSAASCITISDGLTEQLARAWRRRVVTIPNGFDPDLFCASPASPSHEVFRLVYTGAVVQPREPGPFVRAVVELQQEGRIPRDRTRLEFYGYDTSWLTPYIKEHVGRTVFIHDCVGYSRVITIQRQATALVILPMNNLRGVLTTKLFEYMATGRPVISFPKDPWGIDPVLEATGIGQSCGTMDELKATLLRWYQEWDRQGDIRMNRNLGEIWKWNRRKQAETLDALCREIVSSPRRHR